jgi:hypothetical protein
VKFLLLQRNRSRLRGFRRFDFLDDLNRRWRRKDFFMFFYFFILFIFF